NVCFDGGSGVRGRACPPTYQKASLTRFELGTTRKRRRVAALQKGKAVMVQEGMMGSITFEEGARSQKGQMIVDSKHMAAVELMNIIAERKADRKRKAKFEKPNSRAYYFELYQQCYKIVCGADVDSVLNSR